MRALILLHRWLGVAFCLLFAMWFATGIVMHFVPFPGADGNGAICRDWRRSTLASVKHSPAEATGSERHDGRHAHPAGAAERWPGLLDRRRRPHCRAARDGPVGCRRTFARLGAGDCPRICEQSRLERTRSQIRRPQPLRSVDRAGSVRSTPSVVSDRARRCAGDRALCVVDNRGGCACHGAPRARVELRRQRRALDLPDGTAQPSGGMEPVVMVALALGVNRRECGRRDRSIPTRRRRFAVLVALSRLAGLALLARPVLHAVCADLDIQRLAVDGQRRFIFDRQAGGRRNIGDLRNAGVGCAAA